VAIGSLSMFSIMGLLLYFNLYAQSPEGLGLTALEAGASLLPLSAALLFARPVSYLRCGAGRATQCHDVHHTSHMRWHYLAQQPFQSGPYGRSEVTRRSVPLTCYGASGVAKGFSSRMPAFCNMLS
jgi:hypothetical protein